MILFSWINIYVLRDIPQVTKRKTVTNCIHLLFQLVSACANQLPFLCIDSHTIFTVLHIHRNQFFKNLPIYSLHGLNLLVFVSFNSEREYEKYIWFSFYEHIKVHVFSHICTIIEIYFALCYQFTSLRKMFVFLQMSHNTR
jgi:hypothetical protein